MIEELERKLNGIYESYGFRRFNMSKFEQYDFYAKNRDYLGAGQIITFNDINGQLLALKPDITLSVIKNNTGENEKVYYNETIYRAQEGAFKEIPQTGVESIGAIDNFEVAEVLSMAVKSLAAISDTYILNLSDAAFMSSLFETMGADEETRKDIAKAFSMKNPARIDTLMREGRVNSYDGKLLKSLMGIYMPLREGIQAANELLAGTASSYAFRGLTRIADLLEEIGAADNIYLDFSLVNNMTYYTGVTFQGYAEGIPFPLLFGGRYDGLPQKLGKDVGAVGFGIYLNRITEALGSGRSLDCDCLLVYQHNDDYQDVTAVADLLRSRGESVRCIRNDQLGRLKKKPRAGRMTRYKNGLLEELSDGRLRSRGRGMAGSSPADAGESAQAPGEEEAGK